MESVTILPNEANPYDIILYVSATTCINYQYNRAIVFLGTKCLEFDLNILLFYTCHLLWNQIEIPHVCLKKNRKI